MTESTILGVSVRALLAIFTVAAGFLFITGVTFLIGGDEIVNIALVAVIGFVNLVLGFYLGQKVNSGSNA
jgi:hypothetical protein